MSKKIKVSIVDKNTLRLEEDAKAFDLIDLNEISNVDTSIILEKIKLNEEKIYLKKIEEAKKQWLLESKTKENEDINNLVLEKSKLEEKLNSVEKVIRAELLMKFNEDKNRLDNEIISLKNKINIINVEHNNKYENEVRNLKQELLAYKEKTVLEKEKLVMEERQKSTEIVLEKQKQIERLTYERSALNVKLIGENLEKWCDNEFNSQVLSTLDYVYWGKDNEAIKEDGDKKGTKADFVYRVYASSSKEIILTSAVLEMKSEDLNSENKQTNSKFFKKLDDDRRKKNTEYAILVSELEWDTINDIPIKKVNDYEKMYIVRPQYFMFFLNVITSLGLKYKDLIMNKEKEMLMFRDTELILSDFEEMKNNILNLTIRHTETHLNEIVKQVDNIQLANQKIKDAANMILNTYLIQIKNKIDNFKIKKIIKEIDNINLNK